MELFVKADPKLSLNLTYIEVKEEITPPSTQIPTPNPTHYMRNLMVFVAIRITHVRWVSDGNKGAHT